MEELVREFPRNILKKEKKKKKSYHEKVAF